MDTFDNINHVNITPEQRAQTLIEALPYIQRYYGKTIVIKYGGNAMISEELRRAVIDDIVMLSLIGVRVIVVHGGGKQGPCQAHQRRRRQGGRPLRHG